MGLVVYWTWYCTGSVLDLVLYVVLYMAVCCTWPCTPCTVLHGVRILQLLTSGQLLMVHVEQS